MTKQEKAAIVSILTNSALAVVKFILASVTASVALLAEAYHSFTDILSSTMVLIALRADRRDNSASKESQSATREEVTAPKPRSKLFGPGNWENKVAIGIGILLIFVAINIFSKISQPGSISVRYPLLAAAVVGLLAVCSYVLYRFEVSVGKDTDSTALIADGHHAQTDMLASALVVIALVGTRLGLELDRVAAGIIAFFILISALYVLIQALRSYAATVKGHEFSREVIYEDILFFLLYRILSRFDKTLWGWLGKLPGLSGPPETVKRRSGLALLGVTVFLAACVYALSGLYTLQPGEQAIVERFGKPLQRDLPVGPGLHYRWPWPVDRVKKADVQGIRRLAIGYKSGDRKDLILWTNIHYLREYSIITGEGPFLDVAMNVHYRIKNLYEYLYTNADPDDTVEKIGYQALRETLGTRPFFSAMTADRDVLEELILSKMQRRVDKHAPGILIRNVCFRDVHPPTEVASAFEDVISAQEDYETYIEQAHGYRKDLLPQARSSAAIALNDAEAYCIALIAQSAGKAQSFSLQEKAYRKAKELTRTRMLLETVEEALSNVPKYIVGLGDGEERPDLWFNIPSFGQETSADASDQKGQPNKLRTRKEFKISSEEDLIDALQRFQQEQTGEGK